jgi:hypothetical protein
MNVEDCLQIWRMAANNLNTQSQATEGDMLLQFVGWWSAKHSSPKTTDVTKTYTGPGSGVLVNTVMNGIRDFHGSEDSDDLGFGVV